MSDSRNIARELRLVHLGSCCKFPEFQSYNSGNEKSDFQKRILSGEFDVFIVVVVVWLRFIFVFGFHFHFLVFGGIVCGVFLGGTGSPYLVLAVPEHTI